MYNYKAHYFLDCDNGIEKAIVQHPPTPEEILEDKQLRDQLYAAVMELPDKQAKWIYARFYLGMTVKEIAQVEGVDLSWVYKSIKRGLKRLVNIPPQTGQQNGGNRSRVTVEMSPGVRLQVQAVE